MAQFISLEQAARMLGMSPEELKGKAQHREIRAFQDGGSWQFRESDVVEYQRKLGLGSNPDLSLSDLDLDIPGDSDSDVDLSDFQLDAVGSGEKDVLLDDMAVPPEITGSSSTIIGMKPTGKQPSDSDVKLLPHESGRSASDSDVRLLPNAPRKDDLDRTLVAEDTGELPVFKPDAGKGAGKGGAKGGKPAPAQAGGFDPGETTLRPSPLLGSSGEMPVSPTEDSDSDFELTPSSVIDALQPDSGSDFELTALDGSEEFEATSPAPRTPSDSDVTGSSASSSGVNLGRPSDSGINLLKGAFDMASADSIELAPIDNEKSPGGSSVRSKTPSPGKSTPPKAAPKPKAKPEPQSDPGATALPIRKGPEKDIFEDTDFEVDAIETPGKEDRTMQLEATSDFDIDEGDSGSEVFALDEDDVDKNAATAMSAAPEFDDMEAEATSSEEEAAVAGRPSARREQSGWGSVADEDVSGAAAAASAAPAGRAASPVLGAAAGPEWGTPWVVLLGIGALLTLLGGFVAMDLVSNFNEFRADGPASGLVKAIAGLFGS